MLSNWSSSCSFFHHNLSLWISKAGLATEAETAAAHQSPYATASYHSSQLLSKNGEFQVYYDDLFQIPICFFSIIMLFITLSSMWLISEKKRTNSNKFLWSLVMSEPFFIRTIASLRIITELGTFKSNWKFNSHFLCKEICTLAAIVHIFRTFFGHICGNSF